VHLYKIALEDRLFPPLPGGFYDFSVPFSAEAPDPNRRTLLSSCWSAIRALTNRFVVLSPGVMFSLPYPIWLQLGHSLLIFSRLLTVKDEIWNNSRTSVMEDFKDTVLRLSGRLQLIISEGSQLVPPRRLPDIFQSLVEKLNDIAKTVGENSDIFTVEMGNNETFLGAEEALEAIDLFLAQEAAQASLFNFSSFHRESWL
jgi:hypothetical protein